MKQLDAMRLATAPDRAEVFDDIVHERRSVRAFWPEPLDESTLRELFGVAAQAPSNCNAQPWVVYVVSGAAAERMRIALHTAAMNGVELVPDVPRTTGYEGPYRARQIDAAVQLFNAQGITRGDTEGRDRSFLRNFRFFDAPHAAFIFMPKMFGLREAADCGMYAQTLLLAMTARGIASCAQGALSHHAPIVRRELGLEGRDDLRLLFGIAFGYEDAAHPTSAARVGRAALDETTTFLVS